jgi:hypothetical protein
MFKWDKLSWVASGIFVAGLILGIFNNYFLGLLIVAYLLRPTLLAFGGGKKYADERQTAIQFQSGNISLTVVIVAMFILNIMEELEGRPGDKYNGIIILALAVKAIVGLIMLRDYKTAAFRTGFFMGLLLSLFILFDSGFKPFGFLIAGPGFLIMLLSWFGLKKPMLVAVIFVVLGVAAGIWRALFFVNNLPFEANALTTLLVSLPLLAAAFLFYKGAQANKGEQPETVVENTI